MQKKPTIFLTFANDANGEFLEALRPEQTGLHYQLAKYQNTGEGIYHSVGSTEPDLLLRDLNEFTGQLIIFHYSGHANQQGLQLESLDREKIFLHGANLTSILAEEAKKNLKLVFLNACLTGGMVNALQKLGIPAIIATDSTIPDKQAKAFSIAFYRSLVAGNTLETAFNQSKTVLEPNNPRPRIMRSLIWEEDGIDTSFIPWGLYVQDKKILNWKIVDKDPLADVPEIPLKYYRKLPIKPFKNLLPFKREDAAVFFGRGKEIQKLYKRITSIYPIILFYGQSGVGKSSLLEAGLFPRLEEQFEVRYARRGTQGLSQSLKDLLKVEHTINLQQAWMEQEQKGRPLIVILDQLEEAFTKSNRQEAEQELTALFQLLVACFDSEEAIPQGKIMLSFRKEYLPEVLKLTQSFNLAYTEVFLERLDRQGIIEAVEGINEHPLTKQKYGVDIETNLPIIIADDLMEDTDSALSPVLQILLDRMWEQSPGCTFSIEHYQNIKKEGLHLHHFLDRQMEKLRAQMPEMVDSGMALDVLYNYITELGTTDSVLNEHIHTKYDHIATQLPALLQQLEDLYLLTSSDESSKSLIHDTMAVIIQNEYKDSDKAGQRACRILESKQLNTDEESATLDELDLEMVELGQMGMRKWNLEEEALIERSRIKRDKRKKEQRLIRNISIAASIAILVFGGLAGFLWYDGSQKNKNVQALYYTALSKERLEENPHQALRLAEVAYAIDSINPSPTVVSNLSHAFYETVIHKRTFPKMVFHHDQSIIGATFSKRGDLVWTWADDKNLRLWSLSGEKLLELKHDAWVNNVIFSKNEERILTSSGSNVILWSNTGEKLLTLPLTEQIMGAVFSQSEDRILTWGSDRTFRLWTLNGKLLYELEYNELTFFEVQVHNTQNRILTWHAYGPAYLWNLDAKMPKITPLGNQTNKITFSQNTDQLLSWTNDSLILFASDGEVLHRFSTKYFVHNAIFSQDGNHIWTWGSGKLSSWTLNGKLRLEKDYYGWGHELLLSKAEDKFLSWADDGICYLWRLDREGFYMLEHTGKVKGAIFSDSGDYVLVWTNDGSAKLWTINGALLFEMKHEQSINGAMFSPTEDQVLTWSEDGTTKLWALDRITMKEIVHDTISSVGIMAKFLSKSDQILTSSVFGNTKLWTMNEKGNTFSLKEEFKIEIQGHNSIISKNNNHLLLTGWNSANLLNINGDTLLEINNKSGIKGSIFSKSEDKILTWFLDSTAQLCYIKEEQCYQLYHKSPILGASFSDGDDYVLVWELDSMLNVWRIGDDLPVQLNHPALIKEAIFSSLGDKVLSWTTDKTLILWDLKGNMIFDAKHTSSIAGAVISSKDEYIFSWTNGGTINKWTLDKQKIWEINHQGSVLGLLLSQAEDRILSWSFDGTAKLWNTKGNLLSTMRHGQPVLGASFNQAEDQILTWSEDGTANLWNLKGEKLFSMKHSFAILGAQFSENEDRIMTWSDDGLVRIWKTPENLFQWLRSAPIAPLGEQEKMQLDISIDYRQ